MADDTFSASDFESAASASSEPASTSAPAESSAPAETAVSEGSATTAPAVPAGELSTDPKGQEGPIPFAVHKTALENARQKAIADWDQQYGWAKQVDAAEFQQLQRIARHFVPGADPVEGLKHFIAEIRQDPAVDAALRSLHARELAAARGSSAKSEQEPQPDLPIQLEDGRVVHLYSAEQQAKREAYLQRQWLAQVEQKLQPVTQTFEQLQQREAEALRQADIAHFTERSFNEMRTWPGMDKDDNLRAVAEAMKAMNLPANASKELVSLAANAAWRQVVVPNLQRTANESVLATLNQQRNASTVNPAQTSTRPPKPMDQMSIAEALEHVATQGA